MSEILDFIQFIVVVATICAFAHLTKPTKQSLKTHIEKFLLQHSRSSNPVELVIDKVITKVVTKTFSIDYKDYVFFMTGHVTFCGDMKLTYIGIFQNWFPLK